MKPELYPGKHVTYHGHTAIVRGESRGFLVLDVMKDGKTEKLLLSEEAQKDIRPYQPGLWE